jgi:YD repeat-containing protein
LPDADIKDQLTRLVDGSGQAVGWSYYDATANSNEQYDSNGLLQRIDTVGGISISFSYLAASQNSTQSLGSWLLSSVTDSFGRSLNFTYDLQGQISAMTDPAGSVTTYQYQIGNGSATPNLLSSVTYPDGAKKQYLYDEIGLGVNNGHYYLTGIVDENGTRFATYQYDTQGRAISTGHAGGADLYQLQYNAGSTVISDPLGTQRTQNFQTILGVVKPTGISQPGGSGCGPSSASLTYDANGNIATRTDFNGNTTAYTYDLSRNLETQRIEAQGKPEQRTIRTTWHPTYRLPTGTAEPLKITTLSYDANGNLLSKVEQPTSDSNGSQGFGAAANGAARTWSWTYTTYGRKTRATDPLGNVTSYTYHPDDDPDLGKRGNLASVTNPLGHVTRITAYDGNSRPLTIIDANGVTTQLTYSPRGWLTSRNVGGELTTFAYDGVGQLTQVTAPDGGQTLYTYDGAHRLVEVADSLGNQIIYTLDAAGNRIGEDITDPNGALVQTLTRNYDALGRMQSLVGVQ